MAWRVCGTCNGQKVVHKETEPGRWEITVCPGCRGAGGFELRTV